MNWGKFNGKERFDWGKFDAQAKKNNSEIENMRVKAH